jgi:hypothetical protein
MVFFIIWTQIKTSIEQEGRGWRRDLEEGKEERQGREGGRGDAIMGWE